MTVFSDVIFPECLSYGSQFLPSYTVQKTEVASGAEKRTTAQEYVKNFYQISMIGRDSAELAEVMRIFHVCNGSLYGFLFKDLVDCTSADNANTIASETIDGSDQVVGTYDSGTTYYPLLKTYTHASRSKTRRIRYPDTTTLLVNVNGSPNSSWEWSTAEQALHWPSGAPSNGAAITAGYTFHVPVRFDLDTLGVVPTNGQYESLFGDIAQIGLLEVFE